MRQELIFNLNKLADELEEKAKAYRAVANDLNGQSADRRLETYEKKRKKPHGLKGRKYNGTHWTQDPKRKKDVIAMARRGAKTRLANR